VLSAARVLTQNPSPTAAAVFCVCGVVAVNNNESRLIASLNLYVRCSISQAAFVVSVSIFRLFNVDADDVSSTVRQLFWSPSSSSSSSSLFNDAYSAAAQRGVSVVAWLAVVLYY